MSSIHGGSLISSSQHSKAMLELLDLDICRNLIEFLAKTTMDTVAFALGVPSSSNSRGRSSTRSNQLAEFSGFVSSVVDRSEVTMGSLLVALVYIHRSKSHLSIEREDWAFHRVFLGALILATKYTNDSTLKNIQWSLITGLFGKRDIGRIEREFLDVLDFELGFTESDVLEHYESVMALYPKSRHSLSSHRIPITIITPVHHSSQDIGDASDSDSDSDSDTSSPSSPSPPTPSTPYHKPAFIKSPKYFDDQNASQLFYLSHFFAKTAGATVPSALVPQIAV